MGYYTTFELSVQEGQVDLKVVRNVLCKIMGFDSVDTDPEDYYFIVDTDKLISGDSMKWYDHDEDCAELSIQFPGVLFKLHGEGEETGDLWNAYYKDGKCQICRAKMVFPEYDPNKMKAVAQAHKEDEGRP